MKIYSDQNKKVKTGVGEVGATSAERNFTTEGEYYVAAKQFSKDRENTDVFTHTDSSGDEVSTYEKYKNEKNEVSPETRVALEELLTNLKKSRSELYNFDDDAAAYRDMLIEKIKTMINGETQPAKLSGDMSILDAVMQAFEAQRRAVDSQVREMKKMHTSLKIAIKTIDGIATEDEIRFLQKSSPSIYEIALTQIRSRYLVDESLKTQTDIMVDFLG